MKVNNTQMDNETMVGGNGEIDRRGNVAGNYGANGGDNISELSPFSSRQTPMLKRARGVLRSFPPPFLLKIYEMVGNPATDSIISWSPSKKSFIIWDTNMFCAQLLPKYFRHNNFASFVYQLNNYGFRKISWEQCEYAHPWFQEGKEHWLKNIKRRNQEQITQEKETTTSSIQPTKVEIEASIKKLKTDQINLEVEIQKLRQQQEKLKNEVATFEECIQATHSKQEKILLGLVPVFIQQSVIQHLRDNQELPGTETTKKQRHVGPTSLETSGEPADKVDVTGQSVDSKRQIQEETTITKTEPKSLSSSDNSGSSTQGQKANATSGSADESAFWKKLLEDDSGHEDGEQGDQSPQYSKSNVQANHSMEFSISDAGENLSAKPSDTDAKDFHMDSS